MDYSALGSFNQAFSVINQPILHQNAWLDNRKGGVADFNHAGQNNQYGSGHSNNLENNHEEFKKYLEHYEELKEKEKKKKERKKILTRLAIFVIPFLVLPKMDAAFFVATELLATFFEQIGLKSEEILGIFMVIHGLDLNTLIGEGKFALQDDYRADWFADTVDYTLGKFGINDAWRIGTTLNFPHK